jgi:hypothetical protein
MDAIHGRETAITTDGRGRRRALALAIFTSGLLAMSAGSASADEGEGNPPAPAAPAAPASAAATCPTGGASITPTSYSLSGTSGLRAVPRMGGNVHQGDAVTASITINAACTAGVDVTLVSYNAPNATWDPNTANRQQVYAIAGNQTVHLGPGAHPNALTVTVPVGCFQIDLVQGPPITTFDPPNGVTYHAQGRFVDAANGDPGCVALV